VTKNRVINLLERLSSGWRPKWINVDLCCETSTQILKKFKVENNYVICSREIVKGSRYIQDMGHTTFRRYPTVGPTLGQSVQKIH